MNKELNIGDYVRTKYGSIYKISEIGEYSGNVYATDDTIIQGIIKSNPNIIDLIEVGDYVNGMPVLHKENDELVCGLLLRYKEENIKNIVTKELFESMKYEIGE